TALGLGAYPAKSLYRGRARIVVRIRCRAAQRRNITPVDRGNAGKYRHGRHASSCASVFEQYARTTTSGRRPPFLLRRRLIQCFSAHESSRVILSGDDMCRFNDKCTHSGGALSGYRAALAPAIATMLSWAPVPPLAPIAPISLPLTTMGIPPSEAIGRASLGK